MGWWPSWKEFVDSLRRFEQELSNYQIKTVNELEKVQARHPIIVGVILRWALGNLDSKFSSVSVNVLDRFVGGGNNQELSDAILDYLKKIEEGGEEQYKKIGQFLEKNFEDIKIKMEKGEETVLLIQEILVTSSNLVNAKLDLLKSDLVQIKKYIKVKQEAESRPFLLTDDVEKLGLVENEKIKYIVRRDDEKIREFLIRKKPVIIRGQAGAGKSSLLYETLHFLKEKNYNNFVLLLDFFREDTISALDQKLQQIDNFVIIWDNLHQKKKELVEYTIKQIEKMVRDKRKNFQFICASRSHDDFSFDASYLDLENFRDEKIIQQCSTVFEIKLDGIDANYILVKSDGTPYYIISLFEQLKAKGKNIMRKEDLENLPTDVITLWNRYIKECNLSEQEITAFQSMALAHHIRKEMLEISDIAIVYEDIFGRNDQVEIQLDNLVERSLLSKSDSKYYAHDSHIDALENLYKIPARYISKYIKKLENIDSLWNLGIWAHYKKLSDSALECFDKITKTSPNDVESWYNMGVLLTGSDPVEAMKCYTKVTDAESKHVRAWNNMGLLLTDSDPVEAMKCYTKATDADPDYADAWNNMGVLLADSDPVEAMKCYTKATDADPKNADAWNNMGLLLVGINPLDARRCFTKATDVDPKHADAWTNIGLLLVDSDPVEAMKCYTKATDADPKHIIAWNNMGVLLANSDPVEAIKCFTKVTDVDPKHADAWYLKALLHVFNNLVDEGLDDLEKAVTLGGKEYVKKITTTPIYDKIKNNPRFRAIADLKL